MRTGRWTLDTATKVVETKLKHPESRERLSTLVRETLIHAIEQGKPIPQPDS